MMISTIVFSDILLFKDHIGLRLAFNIGTVLVFAAIYLRFSH